MKIKRPKWLWIMLCLALAAAYVPYSSAYAERGEQHEYQEHKYDEHENEEHDKNDYEDDYDEEAYEEDDYDDEEAYDEDEESYSDEQEQTQEVVVDASQGLSSTTFSDQEQVTFTFSEDNVTMQGIIRLIQNQVYVPLDSILDQLKEPYIRYPKGDLLEGFVNGKQFILRTGKSVIYWDGTKIPVKGTVFAESDRFYVPLEAAAAALGRTATEIPQKHTIQFK